MQERLVEVIRDLMKTQGMSIRKISAAIAKEHGGSALGHTHQINRILNDPEYDPNFSTVEKILTALNFSFWQLPPTSEIKPLESRLDQLTTDVAEIKIAIAHLNRTIERVLEAEIISRKG
jgi:DNA-binding transcriptional MerR regulator